MQHCDAVVVGEAESVWEELIEDARGRRLRPRYQAQDFHNLKGLPRPRLELMDYRRYRENRPHPDLPGLSIQLCLLRGSHCLRAYLSPPPPGGSHRGN